MRNKGLIGIVLGLVVIIVIVLIFSIAFGLVNIEEVGMLKDLLG